MIMTLSFASFNFPHVLYATGTSFSTGPDSRVKDGTIYMLWSMRLAKEDMSGRLSVFAVWICLLCDVSRTDRFESNSKISWKA